MWGGQINMHGMDKNAKVYYNLFIKSSTGKQRSLRNTQQRAKLPGHSSFLAELQARCQRGPRVPGVGLAMIQGRPLAQSDVCSWLRWWFTETSRTRLLPGVPGGSTSGLWAPLCLEAAV